MLWVVIDAVMRISKVVNKGRLPQNCILTECVSAWFADAILRNDGVYITGKQTEN